MRIAYGVFGYGRGHATRAAAVLGALTARHEVLVIAGGDAYAQLAPTCDVVEIPTLGYAYNSRGQRSNLRTLTQNSGHLLDILANGPVTRRVRATLKRFQPDVVISDAEPWTHRAARALRIPRIGFDHFGVMVYCKLPLPWLDRLRSLRDVWVYRLLMGRPERALISSFFDAPTCDSRVAVIPPLLRDEVWAETAHDGDTYLAYFNKGAHQFTPAVAAALHALPGLVRVYGVGRSDVERNLEFRPPGNQSFLRHLAGCRAVISTAGNQLVGEALHFGKPLLVMPEDCVEQRINAAAVARLGIGMETRFADFSPRVIAEFVAHEREFAIAARRQARDGRPRAIELLERFFGELLQAPSTARVKATPGRGRTVGAPA